VLKRETQIGLGQALTAHAYSSNAVGISQQNLRCSNAFAKDAKDKS
jgi:hypothetical protein